MVVVFAVVCVFIAAFAVQSIRQSIRRRVRPRPATRRRGWAWPAAAESGDLHTLESWTREFDEAMRWRDWQTCERLCVERELESWWAAERARLDALPDPPGAGWQE